MGLQSGNIEGFRNAKRRVREDVSFLIEKANQNQRSVLVAHGFVNRYISKYLKQEGWQLSYGAGKDYFSIQVFSKASIE